MRNITSLALCWSLTFALVAVALGQQQPAKSFDNGPQLPPPAIDTSNLPLDRAQASPFAERNNDLNTQPNFNTSPNGQPVRILAPPQKPTQNPGAVSQPSDSPANDTEARGELGIWMGDSGGPGVRILRVVRGSAADQAGLRSGDVILQINGHGAINPQETARLIRQMSVGETGVLGIWRDGNQDQVEVTMQPLRERVREFAQAASRQVGFDGVASTPNNNTDLAARTERLEQQINSLTQELASLRQEMAQLRTVGPVQTGFNADTKQTTPAAPPQDRYDTKLATPPQTNPPSPPPAATKSEEKPTPPPTTSPPPALEKPSDDLFSPTPPAAKSDDKPKADDKSGSDDLFK